jgi:uncharacterized protein YjdB
MHKCAGLLRLQNATAPGTRIAAAAGKTVTYGSAKSTIATGKRKTIKIKLSTQGRALLRKHKKVTVWANTINGSGATRQVISAKLTLKR